MITYLVYRALSVMINVLPRSLGNWVALRIADCCYHFDRRSRAAVESNLRVTLGPDVSPANFRYEVRWTFRAFGKYMAEFVGNRRYNAAFIERCVAFRGLEHVEAARKAGRGAVLVSAHLGNWELGGAAMSFRNLPVLAIVQPHPNPRVNDFYMRQRERRNYRVVTVGSAAMPILRHLSMNGMVAVLGDRPYGESGIEIEFFGRPALFPSGPARLALATGAAFIPGFVLRRFDDSFTIVLEPPIPVPTSGTRDERVRAMTQAFARVLEKHVRENASQWLPFYPVWEGTGRSPADPRNGNPSDVLQEMKKEKDC